MIEAYSVEREAEWDSFVLGTSINGNIIQTRRFLEYHPQGRFSDASLMYYDNKGNLRAVIPAAATGGAFVSHPGLTYGGIICDGKSLTAKRFQAIVEELNDYLVHHAFVSVDLRFPPSFLWRKGAALVEYILQLNGYKCTAELTTYIDFERYGENTLSQLTQGKRTNVNNCIKKGLRFAVLNSRAEAESFYRLLEDNLQEHGVSPVHTLDEIWNLHTGRIFGDAEMVGVYDDGFLIAAGWVFLFRNEGAVHTQYLCADAQYARISPMTFLYYSIIERYKALGYRFVSWGVSTEDAGRILNWGLTDSKESYGSLHDVHRRYMRKFSDVS